jgi:hypothetical protein
MCVIYFPLCFNFCWHLCAHFIFRSQFNFSSSIPVRTTELHPSGRQEIPSGRFTLKNRKLRKNLQKSNFSQVSFRTCMYNPLITQSECISKLNRDINESWDFNRHKYFSWSQKISNRQLYSCNVCVCEDLTHKLWLLMTWQKATRFSRQERKSVKDKSKVKPYNLLGPSHPHLIHSPYGAAHICFTCTMKDKVYCKFSTKAVNRQF